MTSTSKTAFGGDYARESGRVLAPAKNPQYTALDIYAGAGGLSLGLEAAGFSVTGIEHNADCCSTYNTNLRGMCKKDTITPEYDFPSADVVAGGTGIDGLPIPVQLPDANTRIISFLDGLNGGQAT